jgi:Mg2+-importing ATPase
VGALLPATPAARLLGFTPLPISYFAALALLAVGYLALVEAGKRMFFRHAGAEPPKRQRRPSAHRHVRRRAAQFSST